MQQEHGCDVKLLVLHLYSDETRVTNFGDTAAYPLHMSISNILGPVRAKAGNSRWLLAYMPSPKALKTAQKSTRVKQRLVEIRHLSLWHVLEPLKVSMRVPFDIECPDGITRSCVVRIAFWIADTPEKSKLMLTNGNTCNVCLANDMDGSFGAIFPSECRYRSMKIVAQRWQRASEAYEVAITHGKGMAEASAILSASKIKFCVVKPILYTLPDFSFKSLAFDAMHTLEGV